VNRDGERGDDPPRVAAGETLYRVLVVGGSQPEGYLLDQDRSWPGALNRLLGAPEQLRALGASKAHAGSIARSGVGAEALDLLLSRVLPRYPRLAAIVILVGASDVLRWLEEGAPPSPGSRPRTADLFRCHPDGPFGWTPNTRSSQGRTSAASRPGKGARASGQMGARASAPTRPVRSTIPDPAPMLDHFDQHFRRVVQRAKTHADRVIVVRQSWFDKEPLTPEETSHMWHGGVGQAWCEEVTTYFSIEVTSRLMARLDARAARVAAELGVEQSDLRAVLEPNLATYYDFFHLTPLGAQAVASAVARTLVRNPLVHSAWKRLSAMCGIAGVLTTGRARRSRARRRMIAPIGIAVRTTAACVGGRAAGVAPGLRRLAILDSRRTGASRCRPLRAVRRGLQRRGL
jgi:lysophospholipase L1-like esterase